MLTPQPSATTCTVHAHTGKCKGTGAATRDESTTGASAMHDALHPRKPHGEHHRKRCGARRCRAVSHPRAAHNIHCAVWGCVGVYTSLTLARCRCEPLCSSKVDSGSYPLIATHSTTFDARSLCVRRAYSEVNLVNPSHLYPALPHLIPPEPNQTQPNQPMYPPLPSPLNRP